MEMYSGVRDQERRVMAFLDILCKHLTNDYCVISSIYFHQHQIILVPFRCKTDNCTD